MEFSSIEALITERIGLVIREKDRQNFQKNISARLKNRQETEEQYLIYLKSGGSEVRAEWEKLHFALTVGESYFFRDRGQMDLIREVVFPGILRENAARRDITIWSAGCSTGEEPYSLAMLLDQLVPDIASWNIRILATDLNQHALEKARAGLYSDWSFRKMDANTRDSYFARDDFEWLLTDRIRDMVEFRQGNLTSDPLPNPAVGLENLDFIFCRNVFIYFSHETVESIARKMSLALRPGGYFMSGHGEIFNMDLPDLRLEMHPNSVIYRRIDGSSSSASAASPSADPVKAQKPVATPGTLPHQPISARSTRETPPSSDSGKVSGNPATPVRPRPLPSEPVQESAAAPENVTSPEEQEKGPELAELEALVRAHNYRELTNRMNSLEDLPAGDPRLYPLALAHANLGDHASALKACERSLAGPRQGPEVMLLQARIIEEKGDPEQAREVLRKLLYLEPEYVLGYLEMAEFLERLGQAERARKQRETALSLLKKLNSGTEIDKYEGTTVGQYIDDLEALLSRNHE